jgi:hypothetical protein
MRVTSFLAVLLALASLPCAGQDSKLLNLKDPQAVEAVAAGKRTLANAAWWGFNREDATDTLQAALNSGAKSLVIPFMGDPWIVRPLTLRSDQQLLLEPGVVILAKKGEFRGGGDSLFTAAGQSNIVIRGYGATLRMRKHDYQNPPYPKAEWRMGIALRNCRNILIEGLRVESSGGDGFYIDGDGDRSWSENITLRDCVAFDNHRQGLSVISAVNLLVENCRFANTCGTAPEAGIDLEPDTEKNRLVNCVIRNTICENNNGNEILVYLKPMSTNTEPVSIRFEHCWSGMTEPNRAPAQTTTNDCYNGVAGVAVGSIKDNGPKGLVEFVECVTENAGKEALRVFDKSALAARVRFVNCAFRNPWTTPAPGDGGPRVPILLEVRHTQNTEHLGGIDFQGCYVYDQADRPVVRLEENEGDFGLGDVHGQIVVSTLGKPALRLGTRLQDVDLKVIPAPK